MAIVVFDDKGLAWDANAPRLAEVLHSSIEGEALASYAVMNLGFAVVEPLGSSARIRLRLAGVAPPALAALLYWLFEHGPERVVISLLDGGWRHSLISGSGDIGGQLAIALAR